MEGRGLTLRKKGNRRPQISAPQQITGPVAAKQGPPAGSGNSLDVPRERAQQQQSAATSDLVKRRYSTRFNQLPDFSAGAPPVPGIPQIPQQYANGRGPSPRRPGTAGSRGPQAPIDVDVNALRDPNLQNEQYVTNLLSNAFDTDIQEYQDGLQKVKERSDAELQQQIYQNRTQFIRISKEAEKLNGEMNTLKAFMSDLTGALGQANPAPLSGMRSPSIDDMRARRNANRSSVANLESMWNVQLQALWKNVERSQKFLPAIPGRHIVFETGHWVELDSATWKPKRPVHIVLLNDHLLVASKKRKRAEPNTQQKGPPPTKLVAEECWPLQDIDLLDLGANLAASGGEGIIDERNIGTAVNVRYGNKTFTYRHDQRNESAKADLLTLFRKTVEDLRKTARSETDKTNSPNAALNYFASRDSPSARTNELIDTINQSKTKPEVLIDVDGKQQNLRWVEGQIDDLDIDIALHHFEEAVERVEKLRKLGKGLKVNNVARELILAKADERASKLAGILVREVVDTPAYLDATKRNTSWLTRLGFEDRARDAYLQARSDSINKRARYVNAR